MNAKRVLVVSSHILPHVGGVEVLVDQEVTTLATAGYDVILLSSNISGAGTEPRYPPNVEVIRVPASDFLERRLGFTCPLFSPSVITTLWDAIGRCDVVHAHQFTAINSVLALAIARLRGRPCILTEHNGIQPRKSWLGSLLFRMVAETFGRLSVRFASKCVTYNSRVMKTLKSLGGPRKPISFIPYPIDRHLFTRRSEMSRESARNALGWRLDRNKVLFVGRLVPEKGIPLLLECVDPERYDIVFCGSGNAALLGELPRAGIEYLAPRPRAEVVLLYHAADILVLPSYVEGFPLVAREAMACGLPTILAYDEGYEPYRDFPMLSFCDLTVDSVRTSIRDALSNQTPPDPGNNLADIDDPAAWIEQVYSLGEGTLMQLPQRGRQ
jgi:glycosyltransferase involved in cell wall biosynthesis